MLLSSLEPGDIVFALHDIINDGSLPGLSEDALVARKDQRGVIINTGHVEEQPDKRLFLVRFEKEGSSGELGLAIACWPEELHIPQTLIRASLSYV